MLADLDAEEFLSRIVNKADHGILTKRLTHYVPKDELCRYLEKNGGSTYSSYETTEAYDWLSSLLANQGIFRLIASYAAKTLSEMDGNIVCRHEYFLRWRGLTHSIGQVAFVCAFQAYRDAKEGVKRERINVPLVTPSNNLHIKTMLDQGFAENQGSR